MDLLNDTNTNSKLVIVTLRTLTLLLGEVVIDRKEQVQAMESYKKSTNDSPFIQIDRLLDYALNDTREDVRYNVLYDLYLLGKNDIMFDETHILRLMQVITSECTFRTQQRAFKCAQWLIETHQKLIVKLASSNGTLSLDFMEKVSKCEQILMDAISKNQYLLLIACARLLYTITKVVLSPECRLDEDAMDVDVQTLPSIKALGYRVAREIARTDIALLHGMKRRKKQRLIEFLKVKTSFCFLLEDWDCDVSFKEGYQLLTVADGKNKGRGCLHVGNSYRIL